MTIQKVKAYFKQFNLEDRISEFEDSSATVLLAAERLGVAPQRIAKTLSFLVGEEPVLIVAAGDAKIDNTKYKEMFKTKAKMLKGDEVSQYTGYAIGGVCPFDNPEGIKKYLDISLKRFETVFPAAGTANSSVKLTPDEVFEYAKADAWVDLCKDWQNAAVE